MKFICQSHVPESSASRVKVRLVMMQAPGHPGARYSRSWYMDILYIITDAHGNLHHSTTYHNAQTSYISKYSTDGHEWTDKVGEGALEFLCMVSLGQVKRSFRWRAAGSPEGIKQKEAELIKWWNRVSPGGPHLWSQLFKRLQEEDHKS